MSKSEYIRLSGWVFVAGAFAFLTILNSSDSIQTPGSVLSSMLLIIAISGLQSAYGERASRFGRAMLRLGMLGPVIWFIVIASMAFMHSLGILTETHVRERLWVLLFIGPAISLLGLTLFGLTALVSKPMPRLNWLPLLAGIWYPVTFTLFSIYDISHKGVFPEKNTGEIENCRKESRIMKLKSITFVVLFGLWTTFTLAGSVWAVLFLMGPNSITRLDVIRSNNNMVILIVVLTVFLWGGGLWGWGIARMMNADAKSMVIACALSWSATGFVAVIALVSLGTIIRSAKIFPDCCHPTHYAFLSTFVPVIGVIAAINAYVVTGRLGFHELNKSAGIYAGIAGALGFLAVGLILLYGFGWGVGERPGKMLTLLEFCNIGAALAGGTAIGWVLTKARIGSDG